jgi:hypothetical protein
MQAIARLFRRLTAGAGERIDPLTRLAIKHGTDKWGAHFYTPVYHALFSHLRKRRIRLLEIGIGGYGAAKVGGASLAMWAEYFPNGQIVGIDIAEKKLNLDPRITLLRGSQTDLAFLTRLCGEHGPFDIIIDDGSHVPGESAVSFHALFPRMADAGLYVIEDVQTWYWPTHGGSLRRGGAPSALFTSLFENLNHAEIRIAKPAASFEDVATQIRSLRAYHNILVVEKGDNTEPSNFDYDIDNPHAARALRWIEQELGRAPTAEGFANLIEVHSCGRAFAKAEALCGEALSRWPDNPLLLTAAFKNAEKSGDLARKLVYSESLARIDPDDAFARSRLATTRAELSAGAAAKPEPAPD